jgi:hypothetical protein
VFRCCLLILLALGCPSLMFLSKYVPVGFPPVMGSSPNPSFQDIGLQPIYGAHFYISIKDRAKLGSQLGSHKLSNIYAFSFEVVWEWTVEPLQSNVQKNGFCKGGRHCLMWRAVAFFGSCGQNGRLECSAPSVN